MIHARFYSGIAVVATACVLAALLSIPAQAAEPAKTLDLTVLDPSQTPVAAELKVFYDGLEDSFPMKTGAQGTATISYPAESKSLSIRVDGGPTTVPVRLRWSWGKDAGSAGAPGAYTLQLEKGESIGGVVKDDAGAPIPGATIVLSVQRKNPAHPEQEMSVSYKELRSGPDGAWSYERAPAGLHTASLGVYHHHYASTAVGGRGFFPMKRLESLSDLRGAAGSLTLKRGPLIEGQVFGSDGRPLAGASAGIGTDRVASNILPPVKTDAEGRFAVAAHAGAEVTVTVVAEGHAPELLQFEMPMEGKHAVKVEMKPAQTLTGRVVDSAGRPVPKAYVWIEEWRGVRTVSTGLRADAEGRYVWKGAPADPVKADSFLEGYARTSGAELKPGAANEIVLIKAARIRGTVVDAETGTPVPAFHLTAGIDWGRGRAVTWQSQELPEREAAGKNGKFEVVFDHPYPGHVLRAEAEGYLPAQTPVFTIAKGDQEFELKLKRGAALTGRVTDPAGKPVADVAVVKTAAGQFVHFKAGVLAEGYRTFCSQVKTGPDGRFSFPADLEDCILTVSADAGCAQVEVPAAGTGAAPTAGGSGLELKLAPWGRIEGVVKSGTKVLPGVLVQCQQSTPYSDKGANVHHGAEATSDAEGRFIITRVKPGLVQAGRQMETNGRLSTTFTTKIEVRPGETAQLRLGGSGRPVVGRLDLPAEFKNGTRKWEPSFSTLSTKVDFSGLGKPPMPKELETDMAKARAWYETWEKSAEGKAWLAKRQALMDSRRTVPLKVEKDGSFKAENVEAGSYVLSVGIVEPEGPSKPESGKSIAQASAEFTAGEVPGGVTDEPLKLPPVSVTVYGALGVGDLAPAWESKTVAGEPVKLADFKGKFVLLDFWATWCGPCVAETPNLKRVYEAFGADKRFAMVALSLDEDVEAPKKYAEKNGLKWVQVYLGSWSSTRVPAGYGIRGIPSIWLIGPDGRVIAKDLRGDGIPEAVKKALE